MAALLRSFSTNWSVFVPSIELTPNGPVVAVNVPAGQWHRVYAKESGTVLLESKNGKWEPLGEEDILAL